MNELIGGLAQDRSNSIANTLELLQSRTKPSICIYLSIISKLTLEGSLHILCPEGVGTVELQSGEGLDSLYMYGICGLVCPGTR